MEYLCKCNNCGVVMYDENPQTDAIKLKATNNVVNMVQVIEEPENEGEDREIFWACPNCETDSYLMDLPQN